MRKFNLWWACLPLLAAAACSGNDDRLPAAPDVPHNAVFSVTGDIRPVERTPQLDGNGAGKFSDGDRNTLFFTPVDGEGTETFVYTYGRVYHWSDLGLTTSAGEISVAACYPVVETPTPEDFVWDITANPSQSDFLLAKPARTTNGSEQPVTLSFGHVMHLLKVNLQADGTTVDEGQLAQAGISCRNVLPAAHFNLTAGTVLTASGTPCTLSAQGREAAFVLPAQQVGKIEVVIRLKEREVVFPLADSTIGGQPLTELRSGESLTLTLRVSENAFTISGQEISGWGNQGEINDSITIG